MRIPLAAVGGILVLAIAALAWSFAPATLPLAALDVRTLPRASPRTTRAFAALPRFPDVAR